MIVKVIVICESMVVAVGQNAVNVGVEEDGDAETVGVGVGALPGFVGFVVGVGLAVGVG